MSSKQTDAVISYGPKETLEIIKNVHKTNILNKKNGIKDAPVAVGIKGVHGIGKTQMLKQYAEENNFGYYKLSLAQLDEVGALQGYPTKLFRMKTTITNKKTGVPEDKFVTVEENLIEVYKNAGFKISSSKPIMGFAKPEFLNFLNGKNGNILVLDDFTRALPFILQASFDIIEEQGFNNWRLPDNTLIVLTENPSDGEYIVNTVDDALKTRYISIEMKFSKEDYIEWGANNHIKGEYLNFIYMNPQVVEGETDSDGNATMIGRSPREWTKFFRLINYINNFQDPKNLEYIRKIGWLCVKEHINYFVTFLANGLDKLVSPDYLMDLNKSDSDVLERLKDSVYFGNSYRFDIASLLGLRLKNYINKYVREGNKVSEDFIDRIEILLKDDELFGVDNVYSIIKDFASNNKLNKILNRESISNKLLSIS